MKADGIGITIIDGVIGAIHSQRPVKKIKITSASQFSSSKGAGELVASIEKADQISENLSKKLQDMSNLLNQIKNEKNDIIREQLARYFNILKVYINEALHPTGDWSTDQVMSGKTIKINLGADGASIIVKGERITMDNMEISELSKLPTSDDIETIQQNIKRAQDSIKKLRNNLASAISHIINHSNKSSAITL
jgi:hypothetical protein